MWTTTSTAGILWPRSFSITLGQTKHICVSWMVSKFSGFRTKYTVCVWVGGQCVLHHAFPPPSNAHGKVSLTKYFTSLLWSKLSERMNQSKDHEIVRVEKEPGKVHALPHIKHLLHHWQHRRTSAVAGQLCSCHTHWPPPKQPSGPSWPPNLLLSKPTEDKAKFKSCF